MTPCFIYGLSCTCHPEKGVRYVGQTSQTIAIRLSEHRRKAKNLWYPVNHWVMKHGTGNIVMTVLETVYESKMLNPREMFWIEKLKTLTDLKMGGLNRTLGGGGMAGKTEVRERQRQSVSGDKAVFAKLTWDQVREIRRDYAAGLFTMPAMALKYDVSVSSIGSAVKNETWYDPNYTDSGVRGAATRQASGEDAHNALLSNDDVDDIRRVYATGTILRRELCVQYGITMGYLGSILDNTRRTDPNYMPVSTKELLSKRKPSRPAAKLTEDEVRYIRSLSKQGMTHSQIAKRVGRSYETTRHIVLEKTWKNLD